MKVSLSKGLDEQGQLDLKGSFTASLLFRQAVIRNIRDKINSTRKESNKMKFILEGDFGQKMAYTMGYEKAQEDFIALMEEKSIK